MPRESQYTLLVGLGLVAVVLATVRADGRVRDGHRFDGRCQECHAGDPGKSGGAFAVRAEIGRVCESCHREAVSLSHPVGMVPTFAIPHDFPLDDSGRVTCVTCHKTHRGASEPERPFMLRREGRGRSFCLSCHKVLFGRGGREEHRTGMESAHVRRSARLIEDPRGQPVDSLSQNCLQCHDDTIAKSARVATAGTWDHGPRTGVSHPVGVDYQAASLRTRGFRPPGALDPAVRLFAGRVGCGSCHSPYSTLPAQLVMKNERSRLCLTCHIK
ncbi:MAG: hypothetical protein A2V83_01145 [Nitrospirae bacterium RBG_16_64_22]|nr:MAG: hypothetical protein A2V83_01145 [Nitrospirae bacterium RBG_16_64_22]